MSARSFVSVASLLVAFAGCASSGTDLSEPAESAAEEIGAAGSALTASCDADSDCGGGARCVTTPAYLRASFTALRRVSPRKSP